MELSYLAAKDQNANFSIIHAFLLIHLFHCRFCEVYLKQVFHPCILYLNHKGTLSFEVYFTHSSQYWAWPLRIISSLPDRFRACVAALGGHTRY